MGRTFRSRRNRSRRRHRAPKQRAMKVVAAAWLKSRALDSYDWTDYLMDTFGPHGLATIPIQISGKPTPFAS